MKTQLIHGDCLEKLKDIPDNSIDLVITSPPYDNLRAYNDSLEWDFNIFKGVANQLKRVIKKGGVIVWVVGDATIKGSETGSSFKQALYFKEIGLNLHDTMIYKKKNFTPLNHRRYEQEFEFMFCLSKGRPNTFNPIKEKCKWAGTETWGKPCYYKTSDGVLTPKPKTKINEYKTTGNIFSYTTGSTKTGKIKHPAVFPLQLAEDQIKTWSNEGGYCHGSIYGEWHHRRSGYNPRP